MDTEGLKNEAESWTLQSDVKLLEYIQTFSNSVKEKTESLESKLEDLTGDTNVADVRLRNTFNEFFMLANTQFIENVSTRICFSE